jgi:hypothetical protein
MAPVELQLLELKLAAVAVVVTTVVVVGVVRFQVAQYKMAAAAVDLVFMIHRAFHFSKLLTEVMQSPGRDQLAEQQVVNT